MKDTVFDRIKQRGPSLTPKQLALAEYLLNNYKSAAFQTIAGISRQAEVSEATVVRLADALGYDGFSDMLDDLQQVVRHELDAFEHIRYTYTGDRLKQLNVFEEVITNEQRNIARLAEHVSLDEIARVVDSIESAANIVVVGLYAESYFSKYFSYNLGKIRKNVLPINHDNEDVFNRLVSTGEEDLVFLFSFPRYLPRTLEIGEVFFRNGATVIGFADSVAAPIRAVATQFLMIPQNYISFSDPGCAVLLLLQAIIMEYISRDPDRTERYLQEFDQAAQKLHVMN